jgi:hypothetical protein
MEELTQHLNWEVQIEELVLTDNRKTDRFALTRSDNGDLLGIRSERYHPVFNKDLEDIRERLVAQSGFQFQGYQEFQNGKRILAFYENPSEKLQICDQEVKDYLIIGNSHDTSSKLFVGTSNYMIRCENQFSEKIRAFEHRHDQPFNINEINIVNILNNYEVGREKLYKRMEYLRRRSANQNVIDHLIIQLFGALENTDRLEQAIPKDTEQTQLLRDCIHREIQDLGMNYWALFNGVTRYTSNHLKGNPGFGIVNGKGERLNRDAMRVLESLW